MDEPRWILEVPIPGEDGCVSSIFLSHEAKTLAWIMVDQATRMPELDATLTWNW